MKTNHLSLSEFKQLENPSNLTPALQGLWYARQKQWDKAHIVVQDESDTDSAWVHAYLHREEGDLANARHWYKLSGRPEFTGSLEQEWQQITQYLLDKKKID